MTSGMPRQDSLFDQLDSLAAEAERRGEAEAATWLRSRTWHPAPDWLLRLAVETGCYDAHDWLLGPREGRR